MRFLVVLGMVLGAFTVVFAMEGSNDFEGFHLAGQHVAEEGTFSTARNVTRYLPSFQMLMIPFGILPVGLAAALWYLLNVASLVALPRELERLSGVPPRRQLAAWLVMAPFILDNLHLGQSGPLLLYMAVFALARAREGRAVIGGFVLGIAALLKVLPLALVAVPVLLGRARGTLAGLAAALLLGTGLCVLATSWDQTADAFQRWSALNRSEQTPWAMIETGRSIRFNNQGLGVALARTVGDIGDVPAKGAVRLASLPLWVPWTMYGTLMALAVAAGLRAVVAARRMAARGDEALAWGRVASLAALGMLFVSPLVWTHYFVWLLPGLAIIHAKRRVLLVGGWAVVLALAVTPLRGLGVHMLASLALYALIVADVLRDERAEADVGGGEVAAT